MLRWLSENSPLTGFVQPAPLKPLERVWRGSPKRRGYQGYGIPWLTEGFTGDMKAPRLSGEAVVTEVDAKVDVAVEVDVEGMVVPMDVEGSVVYAEVVFAEVEGSVVYTVVDGGLIGVGQCQ